MTGLHVLSDWKSEMYNSILVIIDCLTKMVYYKPIKVNIKPLDLVKVIFNMVI